MASLSEWLLSFFIPPKPALENGKREHFKARGQLTWIKDTKIEPGELVVFAKVNSEAGRKYAALHLICLDFQFAQECFEEALQYGIASASNLHSKAFIYAGLVAYARPFMSDVRQLKIDPRFFAAVKPPFDLALHDHLMAVRSKHVAHSVNEFDTCKTVAALAGSDEKGWRDASAIGITDTRGIGLTGALVEQAISQVDAILAFLIDMIDDMRIEVHKEFSEQFAKDGKWEPAPAVHFPKRENVGRKRNRD